MSSIKETIKAEIERLYDGEAPKHDQQCEFEDGYFTGIATISKFIDSLPEEDSCIYDTNELSPTPSVNIEDVARVQFASHAHVFDHKRKAVFDWEQFKEVAGIFYGFGKRDSLPEEKPSEELKEAADEYADDNFVQWVEDDEIYSDADKIRETFIAGAEWALNQGVKATGMISPRGIIYDNNIGYRLFLERYHNGDKVEVQVRKIEENGK